jgi:hypothetical protein
MTRDSCFIPALKIEYRFTVRFSEAVFWFCSHRIACKIHDSRRILVPFPRSQIHIALERGDDDEERESVTLCLPQITWELPH